MHPLCEDSTPIAVETAGTQPIPPIVHSQRYHQTFPQAGYLLPSDAQEKERLSLQHNLIAKRWDFKLVVAPVTIGDNSAILDIGTGSAIWLLDVSKNVGDTAALHGMDIEANLFPTQLPANVTLRVGSALDMPRTWTNSFDLVHQRFLIAALRKSEWPRALSEMHRILKPGGWIQLVEVGDIHLPGPKTRQHQDVLSKLFAQRDMFLNIASRLPAMLIEAGFTDIRLETRMVPLGKWGGTDGENARDNYMGTFRGLKTPILTAGGLGFFDSEMGYDKFMDEMEKEWDEVTSARDVIFFVACKPSEA